MPFACSICEEESTRICVVCTKDTCSNHLCEKCGCCSDCCGCEVPLREHGEPEAIYAEPVHPAPAAAEAVQPSEPEPPVEPEPVPPAALDPQS